MKSNDERHIEGSSQFRIFNLSTGEFRPLSSEGFTICGRQNHLFDGSVQGAIEPSCEN